jgi:hypothetical protein
VNRLCAALAAAVLLTSPPGGRAQETGPSGGGAALRGTLSEFAEAREPLAALDRPRTLPAAAEPAPAPDAPGAAGVCPPPEDDPPLKLVWGLAGVRGAAAGPRTAPNGLTYHPMFSLDLDLNIWLWPSHGLYLFTDDRFWGQKSEGTVTNGKDGKWGFSKREFDLTVGGAWNYWGPVEARVFGYSLNNLNRGESLSDPTGFNDGFGVENRFYLSPEYANLGRAGYDVARATFVSVGYMPTKELVGNDGVTFHPGPFARAYLLYDLPADWTHCPCYAFADALVIGKDSFSFKLFDLDAGLAARPFHKAPTLELRLGAENTWDFEAGPGRTFWYGAVRVIF